MLEHPDISAVMRYGIIEKEKRRAVPGFLYGYIFERSIGENYEFEEEYWKEGEDD